MKKSSRIFLYIKKTVENKFPLTLIYKCTPLTIPALTIPKETLKDKNRNFDLFLYR